MARVKMLHLEEKINVLHCRSQQERTNQSRRTGSTGVSSRACKTDKKRFQPNLIVKANRAKRAVRALPAQLTPLFGQIQPRYVTTYVPATGLY
jgi:hypothetical protein